MDNIDTHLFYHYFCFVQLGSAIDLRIKICLEIVRLLSTVMQLVRKTEIVISDQFKTKIGEISREYFQIIGS